jgi:hypothetical protein
VNADKLHGKKLDPVRTISGKGAVLIRARAQNECSKLKAGYTYAV